ncbi:hypothetical protein SAMN02787081_02489 [Lysinibacillus fusiformis]|uniref:Uncharacterized protein n=1 Tax=Lysinibacillus fusiformis TaxID=28031 RepID=A0A1H9JIR3_9BACI|nr:hypothetical protein SAMN02787081_02489 [Lysinibacillus fusiformis]SEN74713.1 hypothetical protein SAMN02787103_02518 [Lysinibacillus fusiformis]SEQ86716.1 hypothetical protein SAMN02787113_02531 [Lysinibacillus fusiformis]
MYKLCLKCDNYVQQIPICVHALVFLFELEAGIGVYTSVRKPTYWRYHLKRALRMTFAPSTLITFLLIARAMENQNTVN